MLWLADYYCLRRTHGIHWYCSILLHILGASIPVLRRFMDRLLEPDESDILDIPVPFPVHRERASRSSRLSRRVANCYTAKAMQSHHQLQIPANSAEAVLSELGAVDVNRLAKSN